MKRAGLAIAFALALVGAKAVEAPRRIEKSKPPEPKARVCFINGEPGVETPGGGCIRVSGEISSQISVGGFKH